MDSHGYIGWTQMTLLHILLLLSCVKCTFCSEQGVNVTVEAGEGFEGSKEVLTCRYTWIPPCPDLPDNDSATCTLRGIFWKKGSDNIGYFDHENADSVEYYGEYNEPNYVISSMDINTGCDLTIQSVTFNDSGNYTCEVYTRIPNSQTDEGYDQLNVSVAMSTTSTYNPVSDSPSTTSTNRAFQTTTPSPRNPETTGAPGGSGSVGAIIGAVVGCGLVLAMIIVGFFIMSKRRRKPQRQAIKSDRGPSDLSYSVVNKSPNKTPSPTSPVPADVSYAVVNKSPNKTASPTTPGPTDVSYEVVNKTNEPSSSSPGPEFVDDNVGGEEEGGRVVSDDGLIYTEVGHGETRAAVKPAAKPAILGEKPTEYASLDIGAMKTEA